MAHRAGSLTTSALVAAIVALPDFTITPQASTGVEVVISDVAHFWQAFDDAARVPIAQRPAISRKEYFDRASTAARTKRLWRHASSVTKSRLVRDRGCSITPRTRAGHPTWDTG